MHDIYSQFHSLTPIHPCCCHYVCGVLLLSAQPTAIAETEKPELYGCIARCIETLPKVNREGNHRCRSHMRAWRCGTGESTGSLMLFKFYIIDTPTFISGYLIFYLLPFHHLFKILVSEENPVMECLWLSWIIYQSLSGLKCFQFKIEAMKNATNKPDILRNFLEDIMLIT